MGRYGSDFPCCRVLLVACIWLTLIPALSFGEAVTVSRCHLKLSNPLFIPISGTLRELIVDPQCQHVFITNSTTNRVEVISLVSGRLGAPIDVGSNPRGIDVTPDGSTLYVATSGADALSVVDVSQNVQSGTIPIVPDRYNNDTPYSIAIASNNLAILSTSFDTEFGRVLQVNLTTGVATMRTDFFRDGNTTGRTVVRASSDKSVIGIVAGNISSGPVFSYQAGTNRFTPEKDTVSFISRVATNGGVLLADNFELKLGDPTLPQIGVLPAPAGWQLFDVAVDPKGKVGYRSGYLGNRGVDSIDVLDLQHVLVMGSLPLGDTIGSNVSGVFPSDSGPGHMATSADGSLVAVITDHGVSLVQPNPVSYVRFSNFKSSVALVTDLLLGGRQLRVNGNFTPGRSGSIDLAHQDFTLNVGAYSINIPAASFVFEYGRYVFRANMLTVTVLPNNGNGYEFEAAASGVTLSGSGLPVLVTLQIGTNDGSITLSKIQARFATPGAESAR
jgi:hypothetical protein